MASVHSAHRCTSPLGVVPVGWEDGVGHCRAFFQGMVFIWVLLLNMLVAKREPAPCYRNAYSVGIPKGACGEKSWQIHCKTTVSPRGKCVFLVSKRTLYFSGGGCMDASYWSG